MHLLILNHLVAIIWKVTKLWGEHYLHTAKELPLYKRYTFLQVYIAI